MQPKTVFKPVPRPARYKFDLMKHGDVLETANKPSAREMFRRWKRATGRQARLISSREHSNLLFFLDDAVV